MLLQCLLFHEKKNICRCEQFTPAVLVFVTSQLAQKQKTTFSLVTFEEKKINQLTKIQNKLQNIRKPIESVQQKGMNYFKNKHTHIHILRCIITLNHILKDALTQVFTHQNTTYDAIPYPLNLFPFTL